MVIINVKAPLKVKFLFEDAHESQNILFSMSHSLGKL